MIEINLLGRKKKRKIPKILGVEITEINFKMVVIVYLLSHVPSLVIYPSWEDEIKKIQDEVTTLTREEKNLNDFIKKNQNAEDKLKAFNEQVELLRIRSAQVDKIIKSKTNPQKLLEKMARSIPEDMWLKTLEIKVDRSLIMKGASVSYKSIGDFIRLGNEARFFNNTLRLKTSETKAEKVNGADYRFQHFEIEGTIETFDPWSE